MVILFDIGHPAHVHLLKNLIKFFNNSPHKVIVTSREKDVTNKLLKHYGIKYICISKPRNSIGGMIIELIQRNIRIFNLHRVNKFNLSIGATMSIAHLSAFFNVPSYNLGEDDDDVIPLYTLITFPFTKQIINPEVIRSKKWKKKRVLYPSYHELAYLHPNNFSPDANVLKKYNLEKGRYVIVRFSALKAYHDLGEHGINEELSKRIRSLCKGYKIVESNEKQNSNEIEPWDIHHVLAFSKLLISDSQTMTIEGAVLGIPSIRINSFVGRCSVIEELENKYKLTMGFKPEDEELALESIKNVLKNKNSENEWKKRKNIMLKEKIDLNEWIINYFKKELIYN